jgi:inner membrane protein
MENLAHTLFGAAIYRGWFERYTPRTLPLWLIGANLPDIDVVIRLWGKTANLRHHRGITHSIFGVVALALILASLWWLLERRREPSSGWVRLFIASLIALSTHPLLDALNNYGVRPLLPFNNRWFYGDLVFIIDPWIWLMLGGGLFLQSRAESRSKWLFAAIGLLTSMLVLAVGFVPVQAKMIWVAGLTALVACRYLYGRSSLGARAGFALMLVYLVGLYGLQRASLLEADRYLDEQAEEQVSKYSGSWPRALTSSISEA